MLRLVNNGTICCSRTNFKFVLKYTFIFFCKIVKEVVQPLILLMPSCLTLKDEAQTALFKDPVRTAQ